MKLFLDFELCDECNSFIADLTREDSLLLDDIARNEISTKFMRHLTYNHPEVIQAHNLGIKSNATMLYGHIEKPEHIVDHLLKIRNLQKKTGGFLTLIPLKFSLENTELEQKSMLTHECSSIYDLKVIALSRLMLSGFLNNISVYWVADGKKLAQVALSHGGNDLVGTAFSEEVYRAAGKPTNSSLLDLVNLVKEIKRKPAQRDTFFNILRTF